MKVRNLHDEPSNPVRKFASRGGTCSGAGFSESDTVSTEVMAVPLKNFGPKWFTDDLNGNLTDLNLLPLISIVKSFLK